MKIWKKPEIVVLNVYSTEGGSAAKAEEDTTGNPSLIS